MATNQSIRRITIIALVSALFCLAAEAAPAGQENQIEAVREQVRQLADAFADEQLGRSKAPGSTTAGCLARVSALGAQLPCDTLGAKQPPQASPRAALQWTQKRKINSWLYSLGWKSFLGGLGIYIIGGLVPIDMVNDTTHVVGDFIFNSGVGMLISGFIWDIFLPNPKIALPKGVNFPSRNAIATPKAGNVNAEDLVTLFIDRIKQRGVSIPAGLQDRVWLAALSAGLKTADLESVDMILATRDRIKRRIEQSLLSPTLDPLGSRAAVRDTLEQILQQLDLAQEFRRPRLGGAFGSSAWRNRAVTRLAALTAMTNRVMDAIRLDQVLEHFGSTVSFENPLAERLFRASASELIAFSGLSEFLADMRQNGRVSFGISGFEFPVVPAEGVAGLASFQLTMTFTTAESSISRAITVKAATTAHSAEEFFEDPATWVYPLTDALRQELTELRYGLLPQQATEACPTHLQAEGTTPRNRLTLKQKR